MAERPLYSIRQLLDDATRTIDSPSARLDAEVLLAACLGRPRSHLHAWPEREVGAGDRQRFAALVERRAAGVPVAHLTGYREFWSLELAVSPDTLVPRPETECLVALALEKIPRDGSARVADLGTGSGAIALAIARERPRVEVLATDISTAALAVARDNARRLGVENVRFAAGDWCAPLAGQAFDLVVSNPPYVAADDPYLANGDIRHEPRAALAAGPRGLDALQRIVPCARRHLAADGWLLVEHGHDQGAAVQRLFTQAGYRDVRDHPDEAGIDRVCVGRNAGP